METLGGVVCVLGATMLIALILVSTSIRIIREDTRLSVYRLGRYIGDKGPGLVILMPFLDRGVVKQLGEMDKTPSQGLVGAIGETRTTVFTDGRVFLAGEEWEAVSRGPIPTGQRVRVVRVILEVETE